MEHLTALRAVADAYYAEGCALVEQADAQWAAAHDPARPADMRRTSHHAYEITAARARTRFRRHDVMLDRVARIEARRAVLLAGAPADGPSNSFGRPPLRAHAHLRLLKVAGRIESLRHPIPGSWERGGTLVEIADARTSADDARIALSLALPDDGGWEIDPARGTRRTLVPRDAQGRRVR